MTTFRILQRFFHLDEGGGVLLYYFGEFVHVAVAGGSPFFAFGFVLVILLGEIPDEKRQHHAADACAHECVDD